MGAGALPGRAGADADAQVRVIDFQNGTANGVANSSFWRCAKLKVTGLRAGVQQAGGPGVLRERAATGVH